MSNNDCWQDIREVKNKELSSWKFHKKKTITITLNRIEASFFFQKKRGCAYFDTPSCNQHIFLDHLRSMKFFHILFPLFVPNFASSIRWNPPHRLMTAGSWMVESQTIKHNTQWMLLCSCRWSSPWQRRLSLSIRIARRTNPPSVAIARSLKCHQAGRPCRSRVRKCGTSFYS